VEGNRAASLTTACRKQHAGAAIAPVRAGGRDGAKLDGRRAREPEPEMPTEDPPKKLTHEEEEELLEEQGEESFPSSDPPATEGSPHI
jgi:hypothetical protein